MVRGGTVTIASVAGGGHYLRRDEAAFEDGTVDYLNLPAVTAGLGHINRVGLDAIHRRVGCLTGWLLEALAGLQHEGGRRLVTIHGPRGTAERGGTVTFSLHDRNGGRIDDLLVEELANRAGISLRTGCFCNPGAGEAAHRLGAGHLRPWFGRARPVSYLDLRDGIWIEHGRLPSAIRISVGVATTFADTYRFACFLQGFVNRSVADINQPGVHRRPLSRTRPAGSVTGAPVNKKEIYRVESVCTRSPGGPPPTVGRWWRPWSTSTWCVPQPAPPWLWALWHSPTRTSSIGTGVCRSCRRSSSSSSSSV